jgi:hypothetical protein
MSDEDRLTREDVLLVFLKEALERFDRYEQKIDAQAQEIKELKILVSSGNNTETSFQKNEVSKKELIVVFLQTNDQYLDSREYPSRVLASILSEAIGMSVSHVYAGRVRKELQ